MDYEKEYKRIVGKIKNAYLYAQTDSTKAVLEEIIPELAKSEDEKVRKRIIHALHGDVLSMEETNKALAWLEKQGDYANFRDKAQVGDRITKNEDGVLVNLTQLKRMAKPSENQGEQEKDILEDAILDGNEDGLIAETIRYKKEKQGEPIDKIVKRAMNEKQRVLLTETNGNANIDWDTRSLQDVKLLLEYGLDYIKKLEKQGKQKDSYTTIVETGDGGINALVTRELPIEMKTAAESLGISSDEYNKIVDECLFCEQKPADKVEPKFKVGDFIVNDYCMGRVVEITNDAYLLDTEQGIPFSCHSTRLWDVTKDAKDGDVLVNWNNTVFIFKTIEDETVKFHIAYNEKWDAIKTPSTKLSHLGFPEPQFELHPATKEQRDTLMKAMADAGYTFDFENKKLKKIEQKLAWSEEDEIRLNTIIHDITIDKSMCKYEVAKSICDEQINWLKSLKGRVGCEANRTTTKEWSEDDKRKIDRIYSILQQAADTHAFSTTCRLIGDKECIELQDWLKSIRPQNRWKPSELQLECLSDAIEYYNSSGYPATKLKELYEQLKKL